MQIVLDRCIFCSLLQQGGLFQVNAVLTCAPDSTGVLANVHGWKHNHIPILQATDLSFVDWYAAVLAAGCRRLCMSGNIRSRNFRLESEPTPFCCGNRRQGCWRVCRCSSTCFFNDKLMDFLPVWSMINTVPGYATAPAVAVNVNYKHKPPLSFAHLMFTCRLPN